VSTRKVTAITGAVWPQLLASTISEINQSLDAALARLPSAADEPYPYLILDAATRRSPRRRHPVPGGAGGAGHQLGWPREVLAVELANRESGPAGRTSSSGWASAASAAWSRRLRRSPRIKQALREILPAAAWQRCYVHFLRNALDHLPRKADDDCLQELRWLYDA